MEPIYFTGSSARIELPATGPTSLGVHRADLVLEFCVSDSASLQQPHPTDAAPLPDGDARFQTLVAATAAVVWSATGDGIGVPSASWESYTGQRWPAYQGIGAIDAVHLEDRPAVLAAWSEALARGEPMEVGYRLRRADGVYRRVRSRGLPIRARDGSVREWIGIIRDVEDQLQAEDALRYLSDASAALAASLEYEATLQTVARLLVPALADWCAIDLAEADGQLRRIAMTHVDPTKEAWAWELERRYPAAPSHDGGSYEILRTGTSRFVPEILPEMFDESHLAPEYVRLLRQLDLRSYLGVPLTAHGQVFGVLSLLMSGSGRRYDEADLRLAEELGRRAGVAVDNARRHRAAVESLNMLDAMLAASPVGHAFVDRELRYVRVNETLAALHDLPVEAHLGRRISDVLPAWAPYIEPVLLHVLQTGAPALDQTLNLPMPDGSSLELLVNCFPVRDATGEVRWLGVTKADVTAQRRASRLLASNEAQLRRVVESPLIGIGFYHRDGRVIYANRALCTLLGWTPEEVAAGALRWDTNLTAPEHRALDTQAAREVAAMGVSYPYAKDLLRKDGARVPVLAGGANFDESGEIGVFYILDLTERRRVEEQAQAAQRLEAIGRLAGGVAHEINNALQGVLGFNRYVIKALGPDHAARPDAEQVQTAAMRAATITRQLLTYSRQQVLQPADVDLARLIEAFAPMLRQALGPERELVVRPPAAGSRGYAVHADRTQLEQVLLNLALNARDAMPDGGRLALGLDALEVTSAWLAAHPSVPVEPGPFVQLTLADNGVGMDPSVLRRIFEPFFTTKAPGQGTGLGLSVVYGIVKQSGGHVWAESAPGQGTRITVLLPAALVPTSDDRGPSPAPPSVGGTETVLVVDDDPLVLAVAANSLAEQGYRVVTAANGREALERLDAHDEAGSAAVALVVTDLAMPLMNGRVLAHALAERRPDLPILFISGYPGDAAEHQGLMDAGSDFVAKPFTPAMLCERVRRALDRRKGVAGGSARSA